MCTVKVLVNLYGIWLCQANGGHATRTGTGV